MNKRLYNLLREKNKLEKKRDEITSEFFETVVNWSWNGQERGKLLKKYRSSIEELRVVQQHLELELASELADKGEFWKQKTSDD